MYDTNSVSSFRSVFANEFAPLNPSDLTSFGIKARMPSLSFTEMSTTGAVLPGDCCGVDLYVENEIEPPGPHGTPNTSRPVTGSRIAISEPSNGKRSSFKLIFNCFSIAAKGDSNELSSSG